MKELTEITRWLATPLFDIGGTPVSIVRLLGLVVIVVGAWWAGGRIEYGIRRLGKQHSQNTASVNALARVTRYIAWAAATFIGLNYIGINLASLAIVGGAIGVGVGFGLQSIFSNFFSGIVLLLEKTIKEGDFVDLQSGTRGHVSEIGLRYTRVTTNDEVDVIVPNSEFINGRVVNWTFGSPYRRVHIPFGVGYGSDKSAVKAAGLAAAASLDTTFTDDLHTTDVWLVGLGDSSLDFELVVWVAGKAVDAPARVEAAYKWAVHDELLKAGLEVPFPQRDLHIRSGELRVRLDPPIGAGSDQPRWRSPGIGREAAKIVDPLLQLRHRARALLRRCQVLDRRFHRLG